RAPHDSAQTVVHPASPRPWLGPPAMCIPRLETARRCEIRASGPFERMEPMLRYVGDLKNGFGTPVQTELFEDEHAVGRGGIGTVFRIAISAGQAASEDRSAIVDLKQRVARPLEPANLDQLPLTFFERHRHSSMKPEARVGRAPIPWRSS